MSDESESPFEQPTQQQEFQNLDTLASSRAAESAEPQPTESAFEHLPTIEGYTITDTLGRGGMGVVYRATDTRLKRPVALKVMRSGEHSDELERKRFVREAETIAQLQHPGIVQIFEVGQHDGNMFLALELVDGGTLSGWMKKNRTDLRSSVVMMLQLVRIMEFAHRQNIVHRDLKPGNILVCDEEVSSLAVNESGSMFRPVIDNYSSVGLPIPPVSRIKVTDFGLARRSDLDQQLTRTGVAVGTPTYMSPEQVKGEVSQNGPGTDIYALGVILYQMLTGGLPLEGDDALSTMMKVIDEDPVSPRTINKQINRDLETICLKCLEKAPEQRYLDCGELAKDLELYLAGEPIQSRPISIVAKTLRWSRRFPLLAGTLLTCSILFLVHLFMAEVLRLELHRKFEFRAMITLVLGGLVGMTYVVQWLVGPKNRQMMAGIFAVVSVAVVTLVLSVDKGPVSAPVPIYFVIIASTGLVAPHPRTIWYVTISAVLGYLTLVLYSSFYVPENMVSIEIAIVYSLLLVIMGVQIHLLLRRNQAV